MNIVGEHIRHTNQSDPDSLRQFDPGGLGGFLCKNARKFAIKCCKPGAKGQRDFFTNLLYSLTTINWLSTGMLFKRGPFKLVEKSHF